MFEYYINNPEKIKKIKIERTDFFRSSLGNVYDVDRIIRDGLECVEIPMEKIKEIAESIIRNEIYKKDIF